VGDQDQAVNVGDELSNAPADLNLPPQTQFRQLNTRLDNLADQISRISNPPSFRLADSIQLAAIVIGLIVAIIGAFGLNERINELSRDQAASEARTNGAITAAETRLTSRLDKLGDQFTRVDERTATLEGQRGLRHPN
jgi:hypothetical protein